MYQKNVQQIVIKLIFSPVAPWDRNGLQQKKKVPNCISDNKLHNHNYFKNVFGTLLFMEKKNKIQWNKIKIESIRHGLCGL